MDLTTQVLSEGTKKSTFALSNQTDSGRPVKVIQFGEGNFLRGFADYMIDIANEQGVFDGNIIIVKPIAYGSLTAFHEQDCNYTVSLRGLQQGTPTVTNRWITSVKDAVDSYSEYEKYESLARLSDLRFVISNTTEAGIRFDQEDQFDFSPPSSFPGKLTKFLYHRYQYFRGDENKGLIMLPVELIDSNGEALKNCILQYIDLWKLGFEFKNWILKACIFTSTLVDRIITGFPKDQKEEEWKKLGYEDKLLVNGEPFGLWVIESEVDISNEFPLHKAGLPVLFTKCLKPYKERKVRILNGAHTSLVPVSYFCDNDSVRESMEDSDILRFLHKLLQEEVIPTLSLPKEDLDSFTSDVMERFCNPYIEHKLLSISLNSISKWKARCLPTFLTYIKKTNSLPKYITFSLAALLFFYQGEMNMEGEFIGKRNGISYPIMDEENVLRFFNHHSSLESHLFVSSFFKENIFIRNELLEIKDIVGTDEIINIVTEHLENIRKSGMRNTLCRLLSE